MEIIVKGILYAHSFSAALEAVSGFITTSGIIREMIAWCLAVLGRIFLFNAMLTLEKKKNIKIRRNNLQVLEWKH